MKDSGQTPVCYARTGVCAPSSGVFQEGEGEILLQDTICHSTFKKDFGINKSLCVFVPN